jgi:hypothetical protein
MALAPNFTSSQATGDLSVGTLTDTSTGYSGSGITGRLVYFRKFDGNYLVPSGTSTTYIAWPYVAGTGDTLTFDMLDKDYCLDITVQYFAGSTVSTSKVILTLFIGYGDTYLRQLTQALAANLTTITRNNFWLNKNKLRVLLDDATQAVELLNDQTIAQFCLDEETRLIANQSNFF